MTTLRAAPTDESSSIRTSSRVVGPRRLRTVFLARRFPSTGRRRGGAAGRLQAHRALSVPARDAAHCVAALPTAPLEQAEALEQLRALEHGIRIKRVSKPDYDSIGVDTPEDLEPRRPSPLAREREEA